MNSKRDINRAFMFIKKSYGIIIADTSSILRWWKQFYSYLLNVHQSSSFERNEIYTAEPDIPEPSLVELELAIENLRKT